MDFSEYEKMECSLSRLVVTKEMEKAMWVVTEKIHGANFSFHVDGDSVKLARRRAFLKENEGFFGYQDAAFMKTYPDKMKDVYKSVVKRFPDQKITQVSIWGEIFGGRYIVDGENLNKTKQKPVQAEILYTPNIEWAAYDISYKIEDTSGQEYLDYDVIMEIFEEFGIFYLKPLFKGSMSEAMNYDLKFDSTIPSLFGLPALPKGCNIVEGVVAKPMKNLKCKDKYDTDVRVIVKLKNENFQEINDTPKKGGKKSEKPLKLGQKMSAYATEQRMINAISKHGHPGDEKVADAVTTEFIDDIFVDMREDEDLSNEWEATAKSEQDKIKKNLMGKAKGLIKKIEHTR